MVLGGLRCISLGAVDVSWPLAFCGGWLMFDEVSVLVVVVWWV